MNIKRLIWLLTLACWITSGCNSARQLAPAPAPAPSVSAATISISPSRVLPGSPDLSLAITGSNFVTGSVLSQAVWSVNGTETFLPTTFVDNSHLTAALPATLLASPVLAGVYVREWDYIENVVLSKSQPAFFTVTSSDALFINSITPDGTSAGSPNLTVIIAGANLAPTAGHEYAVVGWSANGSELVLLTPISISNAEVIVTIPALLLSNPVNSRIMVEFRDYRDFPEDPPHAKSNAVSFDVQ